MLNKEQIYLQVSRYYARYLNSLDWSDPLYLDLQVLMRNKFMTLAYYKLMGGKKHRICSEWVSTAALAILNEDGAKCRGKGLWLEHIVPKQKYITANCESLARKGTISADEIFDIMTPHFHTQMKKFIGVDAP